MRSLGRRRGLAAFTLVAAAVSVPACGGGSSSPSPPAAQDTSAATATTATAGTASAPAAGTATSARAAITAVAREWWAAIQSGDAGRACELASAAAKAQLAAEGSGGDCETEIGQASATIRGLAPDATVAVDSITLRGDEATVRLRYPDPDRSTSLEPQTVIFEREDGTWRVGRQVS